MPEADPHGSRPLLVNGEALKMKVTPPPYGSGDKHHPRTPEEAREILLPQVRSVVSSIQGLATELRADRVVYVETRLLPNYVAASYFPGRLLRFIGAVSVGSRADSALYETKARATLQGTRRLVLAVSNGGLKKLASLIENPGASQSERQAFDEIQRLDEIALAGLERIVSQGPTSSAPATWEAILHPDGLWDQQLAPADTTTLRKWEALVCTLGGALFPDYVREVGGLTFVPVTLPGDAITAAAGFNPLRSLRPMPVIRPLPAFGLRSAARLAAPLESAPFASEPTVAIFDGGVDIAHAQAGLFPFGTSDLTSAAAEPNLLQHGTGVTGAVAYGLVGPGVAPQLRVPIESYRVLPPPASVPMDMGLYWILDQIKAAVIRDGHRIVNLSLGPSEAVTDDAEPNRWTAELDQLAWERDVLFIVAAGNDGCEDRATGLHRVQVPADMANGLAIGACDCAEPEAPWSRAPYSSMGPGRQGNRVQPAGVQFGGTDTNPFQLLQADGTFAAVCGTSFAAPLATHALADLATRLPRWNASVLRAFAAHFVEQHRQHVKLCDELGRGRLPLSYDSALSCGANEAHVLFMDEIERFDRLGYQVPVPVGATGAVEVLITLAYASPVEPTQPTEYTEASLELCFRPHHLNYRFSPPKGTQGTSVECILTSDEARRLLEGGWAQSQEPVTKPVGAEPNMPEHQLRESGKWETLRHVRVKLKAGEVEQPRLELSYVARLGGALDRNASKVPFALLLTVIDLSGAGDLYDRTTAQFAALRPVTQIRSRVRVPALGSPSSQ